MKDLTGNIEKDSNIILKDLVDGAFNIKNVNELEDYVKARKTLGNDSISNDYLKSIFEELETNGFISSKGSDVVKRFVDGGWCLNPITLTEKGRNKVKMSSVIKDSSVYKAAETIKGILK
ncbi:MAG: hypothetical protein GX367_09615 [Bacteroidales bacterium]|nr:hypothetical protein [Bacteroidales bacterium]